jgi:hypothetical protein
MGAATDAPRPGSGQQALPHRPVGEGGQGGVPGGQHQGEHILPVEAAVPGGLGRGRDLSVVEPGQVVDVVDHHGEVVAVSEQVLLEPGRQGGQPHIEVAQGHLVGVAERGPRQGELGVVALEQVRGLRVEVEAAATLVEGVDSGVERGVESDGVGVCCQQRRKFFFQRGAELGRVRGAQREEHRRHSVQHPTAPLESDQGVLHGRLGGIRRDRGDLGELLGHAGSEGGSVVLVPDLGEGRQLIRQGAGGEERIRGVGHAPSLGRTR